MAIATIQKVNSTEPIDSIRSANVTLNNGESAIDFGAKFKAGDLCILIDAKAILAKKNAARLDFPNFVVPLSVLEGPDEEMIIGISQQPWGDQLQLGPYDDALVIEEGTDVTKQLNLI